MKRYLVLAVCVCLATVIWAMPVSGAQLQNYVVGKMGFYSPDSNDLEGFDNGFNGEIALGHYFGPNLAGEIGLGYFGTSGKFYGYDVDAGYFSEDFDIDVTPVTLSLKAVFPVARHIEFYGIGGIGAYFVRGSIDVATEYWGDYDLSDDDTAFGAHLGGGFNINLDRRIFLGAEAKYIWAEADFKNDFDNLSVDLGGFVFTANLGYRF